MRVLHFITSLKIGGAESALFNYLSEVATQDKDNHFVAYLYDGPNVDKIKSLGIPVFKISGHTFRYSPLIFFRLKKLIKDINPDIIHSSLWAANIISRIFVKFVDLPLVCDLHGSSFDEGRFRNFLDKLTVSASSKTVAVSESVKLAYVQNIVKTIKNQTIKNNIMQNLTVVKNGIDFHGIKNRASLCEIRRSDIGLRDDDFVVGAVGRLDPIKSYDVLIRAFALFIEKNKNQICNLKLVIVGGGSQLSQLQQLAIKLQISKNVVFTGFCSDACCFYQLFDCFALSSRSEGLSISLLEAMSFGLPVISTNPDKVHDVIIDGINGFLVKYGDIAEYAESINKLYQSSELCKQISACNLKLVSEVFLIQNVVKNYKKIYQDILLKT